YTGIIMSSSAPSRTTVRVRYAETDQMGVVYHANYFVWLEIGRVELLRQLGFDYKEMDIADDFHLPVVEASGRYRASARYDAEHDEYVCGSALFQQGSHAWHDGVVRSGQNAEADAVHIFLDSGVHDHLRRLAQSGVDHFHAGIA